MTENFMVGAVMDGVSSCEYSHLSANLLSREFPDIATPLIESEHLDSKDYWLQVNKSLSKKIVQYYTARQANLGQDVPETVMELREAAADIFGTTLELVIVSRNTDENKRRPYWYVRLSGDGAVFNLSNKRFGRVLLRRVWPNPGAGNPSKQAVWVLPASDEEPVVMKGFLNEGVSLILCTDGVSDYLEHEQSWRSLLRGIVENDNRTFESLLRFISTDVPDAFDDKTIVVLG